MSLFAKTEEPITEAKEPRPLYFRGQKLLLGKEHKFVLFDALEILKPRDADGNHRAYDVHQIVELPAAKDLPGHEYILKTVGPVGSDRGKVLIRTTTTGDLIDHDAREHVLGFPGASVRLMSDGKSKWWGVG